VDTRIGLAEHTVDWNPFLAAVGFLTLVEGRCNSRATKTAAIQRDVNILRNGQTATSSSSTLDAKSCSWEGVTLCVKCTLGADCLESSLAEKDIAVLQRS